MNVIEKIPILKHGECLVHYTTNSYLSLVENKLGAQRVLVIILFRSDNVERELLLKLWWWKTIRVEIEYRMELINHESETNECTSSNI